jgi:hypothetical protein
MAGLSGIQADIKLATAVDAARIPAAPPKSTVFIVQMRDDPAVVYSGGIGNLKATKPGKGQKLNPNSADVRKYVTYLDGNHDRALAAVGAGTKIYSYHYALNGFAAVLTPAQVAALRARDDVVQVWRDVIRQPATDSTPDYLGLTGTGGVWDLQGKGEASSSASSIPASGRTPQLDQLDFPMRPAPVARNSGLPPPRAGTAPASRAKDGRKMTVTTRSSSPLLRSWFRTREFGHSAFGIPVPP